MFWNCTKATKNSCAKVYSWVKIQSFSFKCVFQGFWAYFKKSYTSLEAFWQTTIYVKHLWNAVSGFCISYFLWLKNSKSSSFFNIFIRLHLTVKNLFISWRQPMKLMLHWTDMGVQSCDFLWSVFLLPLRNLWIIL